MPSSLVGNVASRKVDSSWRSCSVVEIHTGENSFTVLGDCRPLTPKAKRAFWTSKRRSLPPFVEADYLWSLAGRRLPQFHLVSLRIDHPAKLPVFGIVDLLENVTAFLA